MPSITPAAAQGLLDVLELHIVPVILGDGMRLLTPGLGLDQEGIELDPERVVTSPDAHPVPPGQAHSESPVVRQNRLGVAPLE
jgi:hypothetical protein